MMTVKNVITSEDVVATALKEKILKHEARIGVIGLGYVGLPLAVEKGKVGFPVIGFDINVERVGRVKAADNYSGDGLDEDLQNVVSKGLLVATTDFSHLADCDVVIICAVSYTHLRAHETRHDLVCR